MTDDEIYAKIRQDLGEERIQVGDFVLYGGTEYWVVATSHEHPALAGFCLLMRSSSTRVIAIIDSAVPYPQLQYKVKFYTPTPNAFYMWANKDKIVVKKVAR